MILMSRSGHHCDAQVWRVPRHRGPRSNLEACVSRVTMGDEEYLVSTLNTDRTHAVAVMSLDKLLGSAA